jgi:hypothetical protein
MKRESSISEIKKPIGEIQKEKKQTNRGTFGAPVFGKLFIN